MRRELRHELPWYTWPWKRCRAVKEPNRSGYWGRCELTLGHVCAHALDRGMDIPRWTTEWTH